MVARLANTTSFIMPKRMRKIHWTFELALPEGFRALPTR